MPLELWAYTVFAAFVTVAHLVLVLLGPQSLWQAVVPFTGWAASTGYLFGLPPAWIVIRRRELRCRIGIAAALLVHILYGLLDLAFFPGRASANPFQAAHPYRPLWTLVLPALWLAVIYSPRIRRYCIPPHGELPGGTSGGQALSPPLPDPSEA